ncbi:MAG: leucine-rich repeat domain-containing protein [Paracoccaceae bacterium]
MLSRTLCLLVGLLLFTGHAFPQNLKDDVFCVDYFGVGLAADDECRPFPGPKRKIGPSEISRALADGVVNLHVVSDDNPDEPFDLTPLSGAASVHSLHLFRVGSINLAPLDGLQGLRSLRLGADAAFGLEQLTGEYPDLVELEIYAPRRTIDLSALSKMPALRVLYIYADTVTGQEGLTDLVQLERAQFELSQKTDLSMISSLAQLEDLEISGILGSHVLSDIDFIAELTSLSHLDLATNSITDVSPLSELKNLRLLTLNQNEGLSDFRPLSDLTELRTLQLRGTQVTDLSFLKRMNNLGILWLDRTPVSDVSVLAELTSLWGLELSRTNVSDIRSLSNLPLRHLDIRGAQVVDFSSVPKDTKLKR